MSSKILVCGLVALLACSPRHETGNVHAVNMTQASQKAYNGQYDYVTVHSAGSVAEDHLRQFTALTLYRTNVLRNPQSVLFLDGYECRGRSLEQTFVEDERLVDQMKHFPDSEHLEIAHAHNTPANTQRLRERGHQEKLKILIVTSDYHAPRVAQTTGYYFTENMPEQIDVLGINSGRADMKVLAKEFFARWQTWAIFKHLEKGSNPEKLTQAYDTQIYNVIDGALVKKPLLEQGRIFLREYLRR